MLPGWQMTENSRKRDRAHKGSGT